MERVLLDISETLLLLNPSPWTSKRRIFSYGIASVRLWRLVHLDFVELSKQGLHSGMTI